MQTYHCPLVLENPHVPSFSPDHLELPSLIYPLCAVLLTYNLHKLLEAFLIG
jgi:hypothetical protein